MTGTEEEQAAAIIAALTAANANPYDLDDIKDADPAPVNYTEVTVTPRYGAPNRNTASTGRAGWRITTRAVGKTVTNAREMRKRARTALLYQRVTVAGEESTPIQFESGEPIGEDDGWFSGLTTWTYST